MVTKEGHPRHGGLYGTSGTMGRGVTESRGKFSTWKRGNVGTRRTDVLTYRRTQPLLWGGVMYLSTQSLPLDSSLLGSDSQNTKELICWANTLLVIYVDQPQLGLVIFICLHTRPFTRQRYYHHAA